MRRPSPGTLRRRSISTTVALGLLAPLALLAGATPGFAAAATEIIAFRGEGPEPLVCTSYPDRESFDVKVGTGIVLQNYTGTSARIALGEDSIDLADGEGVTVKLKKGSYELAMVPTCVVVQVGTLTVNVVTGAEFKASVPGPSAPGDPTRPAATTPPAPDAPGAAGPSDTSEPVAGPTEGNVPIGGTATGQVRGTGARPPSSSPVFNPPDEALAAPALEGGAIIDLVGPYALPLPPDEYGGRLLAFIAAICVLGVTAGIIRAILAQQASGMRRL